MPLIVVTDSTADIPSEVARNLGIVVIPLTVQFGSEVFRDGIDISADEFFYKLKDSPTLPTTSQPSPGDFAEIYNNLATKVNEIISIHISAKLSGTYNSAVLGRQEVSKGCRIEVIDSLQASMGLGLIVIAAAKLARQGATFEEVSGMVHDAIPRTHFFGLVDTLEYLKKGGRIGKAEAFLGMLVHIKPLLVLRNGEIHGLEKLRSRKRALRRLVELGKSFKHIEEMAIFYSTNPDEAEIFSEHLAPIFPRDQVYRARFGPVIGTYVGPGALGLALMESKLDAGD
ncbi:DegV family protein [Chloroflexota bacterium]